MDVLAEGQELYLYPTRGIRRKNIGEFLLWAMLSGQSGSGALFATTLAPENPAALPVYERWIAFAREQKLPVAFGVGQGRGAPDFAALMHRAEAIVSTSVAEGFGLAFLEPWLFGKRVLGRNLPEITADFTAQGVDLGNLYPRLLVPESLLDMAGLRTRLAAGLERTYGAYCRSVPADALEICLNASGDGQGRIDFGRLDELAQEQVIAALAASPQLREQLLPSHLLTAPLADEVLAAQSGVHPLTAEQIAANANAVTEHYGLKPYGERLYSLYRQVADSPRLPLDYADPQRLLDKFFAPERFTLLCSS